MFAFQYLNIWNDRSRFSLRPIQVSWIPAHQCDDIGLADLIPAVAQQRGFDCQHGALAKELAPVHPKVFAQLAHEVFGQTS